MALHPNLEELNISSVQVASEFLGALFNVAKDTKIRKLILDGIGQLHPPDFVMDKLKVALGNSSTLEYLDLSNTIIYGLEKGLEGLGKNRSLRTLILTTCYLKNECLLHLA